MFWLMAQRRLFSSLSREFFLTTSGDSDFGEVLIVVIFCEKLGYMCLTNRKTCDT